MGKVEVKVNEAHFAGYMARREFKSSFAADSVEISHRGSMATKKALRSETGSIAVKEEISSQSTSYSKGPLLDTITLNYCAALGLIEVGVLPKPGLWAHHRMKNPAAGSMKDAPKPKRVKALGDASNQEVDLFDLAGGDSDAE